MTKQIILKKLKSLSDKKSLEGMKRFGINPKNAFGVKIPLLRKMAKEIGKNHSLALDLWESGIHEAKILASMIAEVEKLTSEQMDKWISNFDSWDVCDQTCLNLFNKTSIAFKKVIEWVKKESEFERRAGFALLACLAWQDKNSSDEKFLKLFSLIKKYSTDERNFVKKAVNWALRQIGKRNENLRKKAIELAKEIQKIDSKSAKWIASNALKELIEYKFKKNNRLSI